MDKEMKRKQTVAKAQLGVSCSDRVAVASPPPPVPAIESDTKKGLPLLVSYVQAEVVFYKRMRGTYWTCNLKENDR